MHEAHAIAPRTSRARPMRLVLTSRLLVSAGAKQWILYAMERSGGVVTPPHSAGMHVHPVRLLLVRHPLRVKMFASSIADCHAVCRAPRSPLPCACDVLCAWLRARGGGGRDRVQAVQAAPPSGTLAAGCDLTRHRTIVSALAGLIFALACVGHVLSWCALLKCRARVCLSAHRSRLSCLTLS
jgi:hypothetical protein